MNKERALYTSRAATGATLCPSSLEICLHLRNECHKKHKVEREIICRIWSFSNCASTKPVYHNFDNSEPTLCKANKLNFICIKYKNSTRATFEISLNVQVLYTNVTMLKKHPLSQKCCL